MSVSAEHMAVTVQPDESEDNAGDRPAQREAQVDGGQSAVHWENQQQPQQAHAADSGKHDDGWQRGISHAAQGRDKDIEDAVEEKEHGYPEQAEHTGFDNCRVAGVESEQRFTEEPDQKAHQYGAQGGQHHRMVEDALDTFEILRADVLGTKSGVVDSG